MAGDMGSNEPCTQSRDSRPYVDYCRAMLVVGEGAEPPPNSSPVGTPRGNEMWVNETVTFRVSTLLTGGLWLIAFGLCLGATLCARAGIDHDVWASIGLWGLFVTG